MNSILKALIRATIGGEYVPDSQQLKKNLHKSTGWAQSPKTPTYFAIIES